MWVGSLEDGKRRAVETLPCGIQDGGETVGFDFRIGNDAQNLRIVIEKDFPCAHTAEGRAIYGKPVLMGEWK